MAKTKVGLSSGATLQIEEAIDEAKQRISRARSRWVSFTRDGRQLEVDSGAVIYLEEITGGRAGIEATASGAERRIRAGGRPETAGLRGKRL